MTQGVIATLVYRNETTKAEFARLISGAKAGFVAIPVGANEVLSEKIRESGCQVVIFEAGDDVGIDVHQLQLLSREFPKTEFFACHPSPDVDTFRTFMRAGVRDVFSLPPAERDVVRELDRIADSVAGESDQHNGKVISIINSKSGSGATTLAVNLACDLAEMDENLKVALVDMDIQFGSVSLYLDVKWQSNVMEAFSQSARLDGTMLKSMMSQHDSGVSALPAPLKITRLDRVSAMDVKKFLEAARESFDVIVLDLPRVINEWTEEVLRSSDSIYMVIQRSLAVIRDARLLTTYFHSAGISDDKVTIVDNRYRSKHAAVTDKQIQETLRIERIVRIANDYDTAIGSQERGVPLSRYARSSRLAKDLNSLSQAVLFELTGEERESGGFLDRLMGRQ
ncbi:AAA family ATPase [Alcanivorax sediminis]|uniref:AAA family ATPase n=1 Tax=Alcanivorax sediminis TaxID=2663008 RepID=A0A6N7LS02_9GAMM|nr:AAA family ATPase [Alcanivorax sediminis]MQX52982.1 AAA family ATPase [Alcanivorax sediminis]